VEHKIVNDFVDPERIAEIVNAKDFDVFKCDQLAEIGNDVFLDRHKGDSCFILGSGESLHRLDLRRLKGHKVLSVTTIWLCPDIKPDYWFFCSDAYLHLLNNSMMFRNFLSRRDVVKFIGIRRHNCTAHFLHPEIIKRTIYDFPNVFYIRVDPGNTLQGEPFRLIDDKTFPHSFDNFPHGVDVMGTLALPTSFMMGFANINLLGIHKFSPFYFHEPVYLLDRKSTAIKTYKKDLLKRKLIQKFLRFALPYGKFQKAMTTDAFETVYGFHCRYFEQHGRTLKFIEEALNEFDNHQLPRIAFEKALAQGTSS
jgi:hypothetical protein